MPGRATRRVSGASGCSRTQRGAAALWPPLEGPATTQPPSWKRPSRSTSTTAIASGEHALAGDRFGQARAQLAFGGVRRRQRQKRDARDAIGAALAGFERLGAATWIAKARAALARTAGRPR